MEICHALMSGGHFILINYFQDQNRVIFFPQQSEAKGIQWKKQNWTVNICCHK